MDEQNTVIRLVRFLIGGFRPDLTLLENWLFRLAVSVPIGSAAYLAVSNGMLDTEGQKGVYQLLSEIWSKEKLVPLIAGLSFPLGAIAASHLRSLQASTQIKQQKEQNIFINHFKHLEEFSKAIEATGIINKYKLNASSSGLHARFFPDSTDGDYKIDPELRIKLRMCILAINKFCELVQRDGATKTDVELVSEQCKTIMEPIVGAHSVNLIKVPVNKYDYAKTLCDRYTELVKNLCEASSFYSRHSSLDIKDKCIKTEDFISAALGRYVREENQVLPILQHQVGALQEADSNDTADEKAVFRSHTQILHALESRNLNPRLYYPYEWIIEFYPRVSEEVLEFVRSTAPKDTIRLLDSKIHPQ